ncbi:MAG TPA: acetate--CoA ligase family protein [Xanthobacteraceae bacterium]|nr:acetate--CoA ligase family protein [Xanthobacteraceae bacterium]
MEKSDHIDVASLEPMFRPASVAIIGASSDPARIGGMPLAFLKANRFSGPIYPVNPRAPIIQDLPAFASIRDIGRPVDLALIAVPAVHVIPSLEACIDVGVRAVIIFSAGFAEIDAEGARQQERIAEIGRAGGVRIMGPNCIGLVNFSTGLYMSFHPAFAFSGKPGGALGIVTQSGAFGGHVHRMALDRDISYNYCITTGNEADVDVADGLAFLAEDPGTRAIQVYLEGFRNGRKLMRALEMAQRNAKPVIAIKLGRTEAGAAAAQSHTAALAGADAVWDAVFRQFGVHRAESIEEFLEIGIACATARPPANDRVGLVTVSGGVGVLMADAAADRGLDVAAMPQAPQDKIKELVPFAATRNPIDITGQVVNDFSLLGRAIEIIAAEGGYGSLVPFIGSSARVPERAARLLEQFAQLRTRYPELLLVAAAISPPEFRAGLQALGYLSYEEPVNAVRAVAALAAFRHHFERTDRPPEPPPAMPALACGGPLSEFDSLRFLGAAGLPVVDARLVGSVGEAEAAAAALGYPVALKVAAAHILHKSDVGGVALGLNSPAALREAYAAMAAGVAAKTGRPVETFVVAPMIGDGVETVLGVARDPAFGPVVMFGLGGILVEALGDVVFRAAPFGLDEAQRMIREIRAYRLLAGVRGRPAADIDALAAALARLSVIAAAQAGAIESIDVNPFLVRAKGQGAVALDALVIPRKESE